MDANQTSDEDIEKAVFAVDTDNERAKRELVERLLDDAIAEYDLEDAELRAQEDFQKPTSAPVGGLGDLVAASIGSAVEVAPKLDEDPEHAGRRRIAEAMQNRQLSEARPPMGTGVRYRPRNEGTTYEVYDDGSIRKLWKRAPGVSGRQFRKARKEAQRAAAAANHKALAPILALLPAIAGHRHAIGNNLQPSCGCAYTPEALGELRRLVQAQAGIQAGTPIAEVSVNPETSEE